jgi:cytochrome c oxidase cbb3-type subunit 3/ubiquinol-cytochrome c reductase cytochrome c subunit
MRAHALLEFVVVVVLCVLSGDLECGHALSAPERRGQALYARMCAVCHGREGAGYAADEAPALSNPDLLASVSNEYLRKAITDGRRDTTMSAWSAGRSGPLLREDIDGIVAYLRSWQEGPPAVLDESPLSGNAARGGEIFARECVRCHGAQGTGGPEEHIGNPELLASASNGFLRYAIRRGRPGTKMPAFERTIGESGVEDVVAQLRSWQSSAPVAAYRAAAPARIPLGPTPLNPNGPEPVGFHVYPEMTSVDVVKAALDRGARFGILDARAPSDYLLGHIAGAVSVPFYDPDPYFASLPKNAWLVCYCACPHAESGQLASKLAKNGFTEVTVLDEGFNVWRTRNYPTRVGADP